LLAEPCAGVDRGAEEDVVVEVEEALGQAGNAVDVRLNVAGVEDRQATRRHQVPMVND
jgi:hypothetical protein